MQLFAGNFMGSWKLGTSIRTEVKLLDLNNRLLRANLRSLKQSNQTLSGEPLEFKYYEDDKTVLGYKNVNPETAFNEETRDSYSHDEIKESIKAHCEKSIAKYQGV
jgi:hypothetical protein